MSYVRRSSFRCESGHDSTLVARIDKMNGLSSICAPPP
ncbi:hypothetical protein AKJ09_03742 [Labilithrix luteola]|uniref:Uncharacterized protein n=1 Tax=Labilithrix luteola TaxID=1391654 RepID=A0A0K1PU59_9BACT|nr:hypothetical protein AKJ09_03742 [Labilithrix luteola]